MPGDVLVIGDLMVDVVATPTGPLRHGSDVPTRVRTAGGGSAANTACWLAALDQRVRLVAMVGDDPAGTEAVAQLGAAGVDFAGAVVPGIATGTCVVLVDADGERTMLPDRGANAHLAEEVVLAALADRPAWVHLSAYSLLDGSSRPAALAGLAAARDACIPLSVDASSAAPLAQVGGNGFLDWVAGAQVLFANDAELAALGGPEPCLRRVAAVVGKLGPGGASWIEPGHHASVPAAPSRLVDTVGAGDALDAGVIHARCHGGSPEDALAAGAALAARAVATLGARPPG